MNAYIKRKIDTFYSKLIEKPNKILESFNHFFGEEYVDLQGLPTKEFIEIIN